jgi:hypothetical protein
MYNRVEKRTSVEGVSQANDDCCAQYLAPGALEIKMDETFSMLIADGNCKGGAIFYQVE